MRGRTTSISSIYSSSSNVFDFSKPRSRAQILGCVHCTVQPKVMESFSCVDFTVGGRLTLLYVDHYRSLKSSGCEKISPSVLESPTADPIITWLYWYHHGPRNHLDVTMGSGITWLCCYHYRSCNHLAVHCRCHHRSLNHLALKMVPLRALESPGCVDITMEPGITWFCRYHHETWNHLAVYSKYHQRLRNHLAVLVPQRVLESLSRVL